MYVVAAADEADKNNAADDNPSCGSGNAMAAVPHLDDEALGALWLVVCPSNSVYHSPSSPPSRPGPHRSVT